MDATRPNASIDGPARAAWLQGNYQRAVTLVLEAHGAEVRAFVCGASQPMLAEDIYGQVALDLWSEIERFQWRCAARTYLFTLARNAVARMHKLATRARRREQKYSQTHWRDGIVVANDPTPAYPRSEVKSALRVLRQRLSPEEQELLALRVDKQLSFDQIAMVMNPLEARRSVPERKRIASRLRKRFQQVKAKLRAMMDREGLLAADADGSPAQLVRSRFAPTAGTASATRRH